MSPLPVVIVGAGPTGTTAALLLAGLGVRSVIVERHATQYPLPRGVHLDDEVYRILQQAGVDDAFRAISRPMPGLRLVDGQLNTLAEFLRDRAIGDYGFPQANMFDQPDLERLLLQAVSTRPEITLRRGTELLTIDQDVPDTPAPVQLTVRDVASGGIETLWAPAVLGCDGANSVAREQIGAGFVRLGREDRWLVVDILCDTQLDVWNGVQQVCDPHRAATFMQVGPERYRWEFRLLDGETAEGLSEPASLAALLAPWVKDTPAEKLKLMRHIEYVFKARVVDRWRDRRVFLLGDAAHLTPPFIGQGMGLGLRDAANLTWKLAAVLDGADEKLLDSYAAERDPHARQLIRLAVTLGWAMTGGQDLAAGMRRAILAGLRRIPGVSSKIADTTVPPLRRGLLVHRMPLHGLSGRLVPQPWVTVAGKRQRLDDALGDGCAIITRVAPDPGLTALAARLHAPLLQIAGPAGAGSTSCSDDDRVLEKWLRRAGAAAVVIRPDRVVLAQARPGGGYGDALASAAAPLTELLPV